MKEIDYNIENIKSGVNKLADAVLWTMGPNGHTIIITDDFGRPYATKDGVSVANEIVFSNPTEDAVATMLKQAAQQTVKEAGDGTTTSICLAQAFINKGFELLEKGESINTIHKQLDELLHDTIKYLDDNKKSLNSKDLKYVAKISANNDEEIANIIDDAYSHSHTVKVEESKKEHTEVIKTIGININTPFLDPSFINNPQKQSIEYNERMPIILIDGHLNNADIISILLKNLESVIIVADYISPSLISTFKDVYNKNNKNIALVKAPGMATHRKNIMNDLATYFNIKLIDPNKKILNNPGEYIGYTDTFYCDKYKTILQNSDADIESLINDLKQARDNDEDDIAKKLIQERIDYLSGNISLIKVGGNSDIEIKEKKDRIDDAVLAVKCALEEGIVEGGGVSLLRGSLQIKENKFSDCLYKPYVVIFNDLKLLDDIVPHDLGKDYFKEKIIDPVKVTKTALKNAVSVSKIILSTKGVVLNPRLWS